MPLVSSGVEHGNLRELALARMKDMGTEVRVEQLCCCTRLLQRARKGPERGPAGSSARVSQDKAICRRRSCVLGAQI